MTPFRAILVLLSFLATPLDAQNSVDQMLAEGRYNDALAATDTLLSQAPNAPDVHLMRGYALLGLGDVTSAKAAADLGEDTEAAFLYAMLRGHIAANETQHNIANFWYRRAHDVADSPAETQTSVAFAQQAQALRSWVWTAQFSARRSDNLNFATNQDTVRLSGIPFTLAAANTAQPGTAITAAFSGKYKAINTSNHLMQIGAQTTLGFEQGTGVTSRGIGLTLDGQYRFSNGTPLTLHYGLTANRSFPVGGDISNATSAHVQLSGPLTEALRWSARLNASQSRDALTSQSDLSVTLGVDGTLSGGHSYGLSYSRGRVTSDNANAAADHQNLHVHVTPRIDALPFTVSMSAGYGTRDYAQVTPFFGGLRRDTDINYGITLAPKDFSVMGMVPSVTIRRTQRNSNVDINDATSQDIFIGLRSIF